MCCRAKTNNRKSRSGKTWYIDEKSISSKPVCAGTYSTPNMVVKKVVFDASFKDFRPTTTEYWFYNLKALTTILSKFFFKSASFVSFEDANLQIFS